MWIKDFKGKVKLKEVFYIDNHIHGSFGINFNYANYEEVKFVLKSLYKRNIKGICPTLVGESIENIQKQLALFQKIQNEQLKSINEETYLIGAHLEGTFLSKEKAGIQDKNTFLEPTVSNFKKVTGDFENIVKIVTIAPENDIDLIDYLNDKNIKTQAGHTIGESLKNCIATTHHFNAMNPIHHRTNSIALEGLINDDIYCEIIADLIHLSENILKLCFKTKPKDKILLVSDSLPSSNSEQDIIFCNKKINSKGKDENGTLAGSNKTLDEICRNLFEKNVLTKEDIKQMVFYNQIKYLNLKNSEVDILNQ